MKFIHNMWASSGAWSRGIYWSGGYSSSFITPRLTYSRWEFGKGWSKNWSRGRCSTRR
jgi:hypothetical protein